MGLAGAEASAAPGDKEAFQGLAFAKKGDCVRAAPLLETAELARHKPATASALADCYVALGELLRASELYRAVAGDKHLRSWTRADVQAAAKATAKADAVDARIPTIAFDPAENYADLEVELDGRPLTDPTAPKKVLPDATITYEARARGKKPFKDKVVLAEKERRVIRLRLEPVATKPPPPPPQTAPTTWLGARFRGVIVPKWLMNAFGDGGATVFAPGFDVTLTTALSDADLVFSLGYSSYRMGPTPYKPSGTPDTEYEILESDLQALLATVELAWDFPLDAKGDVSLLLGGGLGVGWTFAGDLYRTQAYPPKGSRGDPYLFRKCSGPNDPEGSYRYCNRLDKDGDHYNGYAEPSWFAGGARPLLFPWVAIPEIGLTWRPTKAFAIDLQGGLSLSGIVTSAGARAGF